MKTRIAGITFITLLCASVSFGASERPTAQITVRVRADEGSVITGIVVGVTTFWQHIPGEGFGRDENKTVTEITDTNGLVALAVPSLTGEIAYGARPFTGFYENASDRIRLTNSVDGKWQPWNPSIDLQLKRIVNPVALYARRLGEGKPIIVPVGGQPVGIDLVKGDWVAPYGNGVTADFIIKLDTRVTGAKDFDATLNVSFSNAGDGIQSTYAMPSKGSLLRLPRMAVAEGYESNLVRRTYCKPGERIHRENREDQNYFFRVRTKKDDKGNIVSALYGKVHGEIEWWQDGVIRFTYYLNPTPNDRNLEFDPKQNLFKGLKSLEQVRDP